MDICAAGEARKLVKATGSEGSAEHVNVWFTSLVSDALVRAGAASWRMAWAEHAQFCTSDGRPFDAQSLADELTEPTTARNAAARLASFGVDLAAERVQPAVPAVNAGEVIAGISDMKSAGASYDVLLLENGLVLAEVANSTGKNGFSRLDELVRSSSVAAMVARHRFVPFDAIASAKVRDGFGITVKVALRDGTELRLKEPRSAYRWQEDSGEVFKKRLERCG
ncbi:hypothetical protein [Mycolicibacterium sp. 120270]|uniref:hypothetical protein n=1 Tax=Mycolicibacterium sp. 120270 TaxID=3090600 RepID=UPI00299F4004|nr:hypothetical protein [Mycolicibacterium sp. 120270]MDX1885774.1 hypothetical protein [Mycolicibacterium sp. 120270]